MSFIYEYCHFKLNKEINETYISLVTKQLVELGR